MDKEKDIDHLEFNDPNNFIFYDEPIFLINEAPTAKHMYLSAERDVPIYVILSNELVNSMPERVMWVEHNIPDLPGIKVKWAGDHSNVPIIKEQCRNQVKEFASTLKREMKARYETLKSLGPGEIEKEPIGNNPIYDLMNIFSNKNRRRNDDEGMDGLFSLGNK